MKLSEVIGELETLKLTDSIECRNHVDFIIGLILSGLPWLHYKIKKETIISRCRKNAPNFKMESYGSKKANDVKKLQRASVENESVFYGAVGDNRSVENGDFIAMLETSKLHRNKIPFGKEEICVSHWVVTQDINMALVCHPNVFVDVKPSSMINEMQNNYKRILPTYPNKKLIPEFDKLAEFISKQFAKQVSEGENYQYLISALFSHYAFETEPGIIYPSTQVNGNLGYNVALRPDIEKNKLQFKDANKHILYKMKNYYMQTQIDEARITTSFGIENLNTLPIIE